jgi:hypothetical protein
MHARYRLPSRRSTYHSRTVDLERKVDMKVAVTEGVMITRGSQCEPANNRLKIRGHVAGFSRPITPAVERPEHRRIVPVSQNVGHRIVITANRGQMIAEILLTAAIEVPLMEGCRQAEMRHPRGLPESGFRPPIGLVTAAA